MSIRVKQPKKRSIVSAMGGVRDTLTASILPLVPSNNPRPPRPMDPVGQCREMMGSSRDMHEGDLLATQMYKNLHTYTKIHFRICNMIHSLYFQRDQETYFISLLKSPSRLLLVRLHVLIHWTYTILTGLYFVATTNLNTIAEQLLACCFLGSWWVCALMQTELWKSRDDAIFLFRSIVEFENRYLPPAPKGGPVPKDKVSVILMTLGIVSCFGLSGMMTIMLLVDPCRPPHLGYVFFKKAFKVCTPPNWAAQGVVLFADIYLWTIALPHGLFYVFQGLLVGVRCQLYYLKLLRSGFKRQIRGSQDKNDNNLAYETCIRLYNELQILNKLFNIVFEPAFFPGVIAIGLLVAIMGMFACLKLHQVIPFPAILFFPNIACDGLSIIYIVKIGALAYLQSTHFLRSVEKFVCFPKARKGKSNRRRSSSVLKLDENDKTTLDTQFRLKAWQLRKLRSLDKIKIKYSGNYVNEKTPIVFLDFCLSQTVSLMLLTGQ